MNEVLDVGAGVKALQQHAPGVGQKTSAQCQRRLRSAERLVQLGERKPGLKRVAAAAGCRGGHNTAAFGAHAQMTSPERRVNTW